MVVETRIEAPSVAIVPPGYTTLDGAILAAASTLTVDDASDFPDSGYIQIDTAGNLEYIYYGAKSTNVLSSLTHALFGTADVGHADGVAVYAACPIRTKLTLHDADDPKAPNSTPTFTALSLDGTTQVTGGNMTQEGTEVGIYYYEFVLIQGEEAPNVWELQYTVEAVAGKTNKYRLYMTLIEKPASLSEVKANRVGSGLRYCNQDGYYDGAGTWTAWTDTYVGYLTDDAGNRLQDVVVSAYNVVSSTEEIQDSPPGRTDSDVLGNYAFFLEAGTYQFHFYKSGIKDEDVERTVA